MTPEKEQSLGSNVAGAFVNLVDRGDEYCEKSRQERGVIALSCSYIPPRAVLRKRECNRHAERWYGWQWGHTHVS